MPKPQAGRVAEAEAREGRQGSWRLVQKWRELPQDDPNHYSEVSGEVWSAGDVGVGEDQGKNENEQLGGKSPRKVAKHRHCLE